MSGSSTLRLVCLAAMAPALTEAASSTRLKLQEPGNKHCGDSTPAKVDHGVAVSRYHSSQLGEEKSFSKSESDIFCRKGPVGAADERLVHLAISSKGKQGDHQGRWPPPTAAKGSKEVALALTSNSPTILSRASPPICNSRFGELNGKGNQLNLLIDNFKDHNSIKLSSGFLKDSTKSDIVDTLKRMNQPQFNSDKDNTGFVNINNHPNTKIPKTSKSKSTKSSFEKITLVEHPGMVNGTSSLNGGGKKEEELSVNLKERRVVSSKKKKNGIEVALLSGESQIERTGVVQTTLSNKMGMCVKDSLDPVSSQVETFIKAMEGGKECIKSCEDMRKECVKKQVFLERKVDTLLRRLKRMKGKVVENHTKEQLLQYVNFQHRNLQTVAKTIKSEAPCAAELKEHFLSNDEVKNMSTAQLVKLVRGCQANKPSASTSEATSSRIRVLSSSIMSPSVASHCLVTSEKLNSKVHMIEADLDSDATASSSGGESGDEDGWSHPELAAPSLYKRAEWKWAVDRAAIVSRWTWLQAQVSDLEYKIRQQSQVHRQLRNSKGGVVLGDQPSPGDILRRMQGLQPKQGASSSNDVKGSGEDSASSEVSPCNVSAVLSNVDKQASRLTQSLHCLSPASSTLGSPVGSKISSPLVNGASDSPSSSTTTDAETTAENSPLLSSSLSNFRQPASSEQVPSPPADASCQASRCRPLRSYRKRKILRTIGLYKTSVKAARLSDIRCRCSPPNSPCPICGGRYNNTLPIDPDGMSFSERVALLDPSFHSVLSFPEDIQLSIHCEGLLKSGLWQTKPPPKRSRVGGDYRRQKVLAIATEPIRKNANKVTNNGKNNNTTAVINFSTKIKNKYDGKTKAKNSIAKPSNVKPKANKAKRKAAKLAREALKRREEEEQDDELEELYLEQDGENASASRDHLSHSGSHSSLKDLREAHASGQRKRKVDHSYDINNIVIPHSIAASTRVEQIQYKEIVTPKWREVDSAILNIGNLENAVSKQLGKTNGVSLDVEQQVKHSLNEDEEVEDLSDDKFAARHTKPEQEEKKRFRNFLQYPPARRHRARSDAHLSGSANDLLLSKAEGQEGNDGNEALATISEERSIEGPPQADMLNKSLPSYLFAGIDEMSGEPSMTGRRKTISSCRRERAGSGYEDIHTPLLEIHNIEPWPRRTFPLSENEFEQIQSDAPPNCEPVHQRVTRRLAETSGKVYVGGALDQIDEGSTSRVESRAASPLPSNESVSSSLGDDPNDPEWLSTSEISRKLKVRKNAADDGDPDWTGSDAPKKSKKR